MGASVSSSDSSRSCANVSVALPSQHSALVSFQEAYAPVHGYASATICAFGVVANLANIVVLTRRSMRSSVNSILLAVAAADLVTMGLYFFQVLHFTLQSPRLEVARPHTLSAGWIGYSLLAIGLALVLHTVACWLTVALAVFRFLYVALPQRGPQLASCRNARCCILGIYSLFCLTNVPNFLVNAARACRSDAAGRVVYFVDTPPQVNELLLRSNYWTIALLYKIIPCLLLSALTLLLVLQLSEASARRSRLLAAGKAARRDQRADRKEQRTTVMLILIVVIFIATELPQGVMSLLCFILPSFQVDVYAPLGDVLDLLSLVNNSVNFVLYTTMSQQFRSTFAATFLCWWPAACTNQHHQHQHQQLQMLNDDKGLAEEAELRQDKDLNE